MPSQIECRSVVVSRRGDRQSVTFPPRTRVSHPGWICTFRQQTTVEEKLAIDCLIFVEDCHEIRRLNDLNREVAHGDPGFRTRRKTMDAVGVPSEVVLTLPVQSRRPRQHFLRFEVAGEVKETTSVILDNPDA